MATLFMRPLGDNRGSSGVVDMTGVCQGEGEGVGWIGNLGLIDADYCLWNG